MVAVASWVWTYGYDYLARAWLGGPFRVHEDALDAWLKGVAQCDSDLSGDIADTVRSLDDSGELESAVRDFQDCIALPLPGRYVPPYASFWIDPSKSLWTTVTRQVLSWYNDAGLDWPNRAAFGSAVRAPDHLGIECAFAAELWAGSAISADGRDSATAADPVTHVSLAGPADVAVSTGPADRVGTTGYADRVGTTGPADRVGTTGPAASTLDVTAVEILRPVFIGGHMPAWIPLYAKEFRNRVTSTYWRGMADILDRWVHLNALELLPAAGITS